ncbi:MAG: CPBP family intramembrane metalloprotease [Clostridia bacterium]|nr:CPBP family intramembrane metalloprotease [Clostridia bacterium]
MKTILPERKTTLFKELSPVQASGLSYSLSVIFSILSVFIFIIAIGALGLINEGYTEKDWYLYSSFLLPQLCFALLTFLYIKAKKTTVKELSRLPSPRYFLLAIVLQIGLLSLAELNTWFLELLKIVGYESEGPTIPSLDGFGFVGVLFVVALLPAIFEEIFFRGILLKGLKQFGELSAILLCGALFSLYHKNPAQTVYQFICGAAFAFVVIRSGSILPTVVSHFLNNAWIITMEKFHWTLDAIYLPFLIVSILCLGLSVVYLFFFDKKDLKESVTNCAKKKDWKDFFLFASIGIAVCALTWLVNLFAGM